MPATLKLITSSRTTLQLSETRLSAEASRLTYKHIPQDWFCGPVNRNFVLSSTSPLRQRPNRPEVFEGYLRPENAENPGQALKVVFKIATGNLIEMIHYELRPYVKDLLDLQGTVIPRCYGMYHGTTDRGLPVAVLILEFCEQYPQAGFNRDFIHDNHEFIRQFMLGLWEVHKRGIVHNALSSSSHIIYCGMRPRIIDFTWHTTHKCPGGAIATNEFGGIHATIKSQLCGELVAAEEKIGYMDRLYQSARNANTLTSQPMALNMNPGVNVVNYLSSLFIAPYIDNAYKVVRRVTGC